MALDIFDIILLRSADNVGIPFCCCIVFSSLFLFYFISFPLSAFCDFSAIFYRIFLIYGKLLDNNLVQLYTFIGAKVKGQGHKVTLDENAQSAENVVNARICKWRNIV